jgi:hypothetical protein
VSNGPERRSRTSVVTTQDPGSAPASPDTGIRRHRKQLDWPLIRARVKAWLWDFAAKVILGVIYFAVISEGLRILIPPLGQKLYKLPIPFLAALEDDEVGHRLDLAHAFSLFLLIGVYALWSRVLRLYLSAGEGFDDSGWNSKNHRQLIVGMAAVLLGADAALFYIAMTELGWAGSGFSFTAIVATTCYIAVLIYVTFVSVTLHRKATTLSRED